MTRQDIERMALEYRKSFCEPTSPTTPMYDVLEIEEAFCQGGEQVMDKLIEEVLRRLRCMNSEGLNKYVDIKRTSEYRDGLRVSKLVFDEEFFKDFEQMLKGGVE